MVLLIGGSRPTLRAPSIVPGGVGSVDGRASVAQRRVLLTGSDSDAVGDAEEAGSADGPHAPGEAEGGDDPGDDTEEEPG